MTHPVAPDRDLSDDVRDALHRVFDPCSVNAGVPLSILDMGLVTRLEVGDDGAVVVAIRTTTPMCTLIGSLLRAAEDQIGTVSGVTSVHAEADGALGWTEDAMSENGRVFLHRQRHSSREAVPVRRREWAS